MKLGFIGFGEVAYEMSRGFLSEGLLGIVAYDPMKDDSKYGGLVQERAKVAEVTLLDTAHAVIDAADIIIAAVPGSRALLVAETVVEKLNEHKIYADVSTSSPTNKQKMAAFVAPTGARFIDGALMGGLSLHQHKVPALVSGSGASQFIEAMTPYHMSLEKVSDKAGDAIAVKLVRSIYMKGIASLEVEMLEAASKLGVEDLVLTSISKSLDGEPFLKMMNFLVTASAIHAERQTHEMADCMAMLHELGISPIMTEATMQRLKWLADKKLKDAFQGKTPKHWGEVVRAWEKDATYT
jgi:3-hydroxyisobutyrate dehydrogenase-like beta-hydroxyacid dehydrogenase